MSKPRPRAAWRRLRERRLGFVFIASVASATAMAPFAIAATGSALREGLRNGTATRETKIIARTHANVYGTRQSNTGAGGAAIYGCRTTSNLQELADPVKSTPCLRVNNLSNGLVYSYRFGSGRVGGLYQAGLTSANDPTARPFITNATGVATGLNADRLDGLQAQQIIDKARESLVGPAGPQGPKGDPGTSATEVRTIAREEAVAAIRRSTITCQPVVNHTHGITAMASQTDPAGSHTDTCTISVTP